MCADPISPLHVRSGYSLVRGTAAPAALIERARTLGHTHLALTDVNGLYGAPAFHQQAVDAGLTPLLGAELRTDAGSAVALIETEAGYENLCRILTRIHNPDDAVAGPNSFAALLAERTEGLHYIVEDAELAEALRACGAANVWLGIDPAAQGAGRVWRLADCAKRTHLPLVATGKALVATRDDRPAARLLAAIRKRITWDAVAEADLPHPGAVLRSGSDIAAALAEFPEALRNNRRLAERCAAYRLLPRRPVFPGFACPDGQPAPAYVRHLCEQGLRRRYVRPPAGARQRLARELRLIEKMGFCEYFLVVWDIVQYARRRGAPVAGRGSGASSLVAYLLGITNVCPLAYGIPFERFLHEQREDVPDLDVDFCWRIRDDVIDYAFRRWGPDRVAMVSTHNTFQPASALREAAKALGHADADVSRWAGPDAADEPPQYVVALARRLIGLPHLLSVHPGGIVIGRKPIDHHAPLQTAAKGVRIVQYDKDGCAALQLVKLDLLGNRNLSTVRYACRLVRERRGIEVDPEALPPADPATVRLLRAADTVGCNQLESPAMRHLLRMLRPAGAGDVMKALALIRPGAASIGMKETFVRRHRGLEPVPPAPPQVDGVLGDTYGVMLYEDDVLLLAGAMLGASPGEADRFRKAVQKCPGDAAREALSREFLARCRRRHLPDAYVRDIWTQMAKFNAYSFCRAHAASYAVLSYAGAYLRAHFPREFWLAALNNNQSMYPVRVYVEQAKRAGVRFLLPDVNRSQAEFTLDGEAIRVGLGRVDSIGPAAVQRICAARAHRPFASVSDFLARTRLGRTETRALVLCGAFDALGRSRPGAMMELNLCERTWRASPQRGRVPFLRGGYHDAPADGPPNPGAPGRRTGAAKKVPDPFLLAPVATLPEADADYSRTRKLRDEWRILGLSVREHPMALARPRVAGQVDADSRDLPAAVGRRVCIAALLEARRTTETARGQPMGFLTFDDEFGLFEVTVFPDAQQAVGPLHAYGPYVITGRVESQYDEITITADSVRPAGPEKPRRRRRVSRGATSPRPGEST